MEVAIRYNFRNSSRPATLRDNKTIKSFNASDEQH
jgi:hypothetical protein